MKEQNSQDCLRYSSARLGRAVLSAGLLVWIGGGCAGNDFQLGQKDGSECTPGEGFCVCADDQSCEDGFICVADRCVEFPVSTPESSSEPSQDTTQGSSSQQESNTEPSEKDSSSGAPEDGTSGVASNEPEPEPSEKASCADRIKNNQESDVDCGGPDCFPCALEMRCNEGADCQSGHCVEGRCVECQGNIDCQDFNSCTVGSCESNACVFTSKKAGVACDDRDPCTAKDRCSGRGLCQGESTLIADDHFDDNSLGWRAHYANQEGDSRSMWKLDKARASECGDFMGEDPAQDHSQNGRNGVAGVVIGGCHDRRGEQDVWDCLWSKEFDIAGFEEPAVVSLWRHLHSPAKGSQGVINRVLYRDGRNPKKVYDLEAGYDTVIDDKDWERLTLKIPPNTPSPVVIGICYQKLPGAPSFAGWTIDDFKLRQQGCLMDQ